MVGNLALSRVSFVLLLAAGAGVAGCQRNQPAPPAPPARPAAAGADEPYSTSFWVSGWTFHLRPLKPEAKPDADKAKEVWRGLFPGMANDPKTRDLLKQLHAGLPVELVVLDAKQAADEAVLKAPPSSGAAVAMRVADISLTEEKSKAGTVPVRAIAYSRVILINDAAAPAGNLGTLAENMKEVPSPGGALGLAMEDYVLRHAPGWAGIGGPNFENEKLPPSVEEQRRDLQQRIKEYEDHAKAFFGARRKR
jgi:hypothetical protein